MAQCQGKGTQRGTTSLIWGGLLVHGAEEEVSHGFMDLHSLLLWDCPSPSHQWRACPLPYLCTSHAHAVRPNPCTVPLWPRLFRRPPPCLSDVVEGTLSNNKSHQILLIHLKAHDESAPMHLELVASSCGTAQTAVEVLFPAFQLPPKGLDQSVQVEIGQVPDEDGDIDIPNDEFGDPESIAPTLHPPKEQGVAEDIGIMGTAHTAKCFGEVALVVDSTL